MEVSVETPVVQHLEQIRRASERARDLVQQILAFSRRDEPQTKPVRLQSIVSETVRLLRATIPAGVEIRTHLATEAAPVSADAVQVQQVIMNLCTNAWQSMEHFSGRIVVALETARVTEADVTRSQHLKSGDYVRVSVTDNGKGMGPDTIERIFEPFFTTKEVGQGTGLGLAVVHGIILSHGGDITVESQLGQGSTFHLYFPVIAQNAVEPAPGQAHRPLGAGQRLLFLDDETAIAMLAKRILERQGYFVTALSEPHQALELVKSRPHEFDLIITDLSMPGLSGIDFALAVKKIRAEMPIVLLSGYVRPEDLDMAIKVGIRKVLDKAVAIQDLGGMVYRIWDEILQESAPE
jgi:CheY-like chemotaxis protein